MSCGDTLSGVRDGRRPPVPQSEVGRRLAAHARRIFRKMHYRTQQEFADDLGVSQGHVSGLLSGRKTIERVTTAVALARLSGESLDYLCMKDPVEGGEPFEVLPRQRREQRPIEPPRDNAAPWRQK